MSDKVELPVREERCETCRFRESGLVLDSDGRWRGADEAVDAGGWTEAEYEEGTQSGFCRRYPPLNKDGIFPSIYLDDWCGEWQAKPAAKAE